MPSPFTFRHSGLVIASELALPEWEAFVCAAAEPDVRIVISNEPCPDLPFDRSAVEGDKLRFAIEGIGGWQVEGGHTVTVYPHACAAQPELRLFTLGSAWGALGYQRGFAMWHGSVVERDGRAVLICGDAGAGKSTMAAALVADGAQLVSDDLSRIEPCGSGAVVHPSSTRCKLWREAIEHFGWQNRVIQRDYLRDDKFHCRVDQHHGGESPVPLAGIVVLQDGGVSMLERLTGAQALEEVLRGTLYRPEMLEAMGQWGVQGGLAARTIARVPVFRLVRSKDFGTLADAVRALDPLWDS